MPTLLDRPPMDHPERLLYRPGIQLAKFRLPNTHQFRDPEVAKAARYAEERDATATFAGFSEVAVLNAMFGNLVGQVATTVAAGAGGVTSLGTRGTAGSGNIDTTPATGSLIFTGTPGSGGTINSLTNPHAFLNSGGAPTGTTFPIATQSMSLALTIGDWIWIGGAATGYLPSWNINTLYLGLSLQAFSGATGANVLIGEPTSSGGYARIAVLNNKVNFPAATGSSPATLTTGGPFSFPLSTAAWSSGGTNLQTMFITDSSTLAGGNVIGIGQLTTPQAVNASNITLSFAAGALAIQLT